MPYIFPNGDVNTDYFTDNNASGGSNGNTFTFIKMGGALLTKIKAWKETWRIRGVEVFMSDGSSHLIGSRSGTLKEFTFQSGERITTLNVQASGELSSGGYRRLGAIYFKTNKNYEFGIYSDKLKDDGRYWPEVGCGICCGIFGAGGDDVDRLGFAMLRNIRDCTMTNVVYPNLSLEIVATTPEFIGDEKFCNDTAIEQKKTLEGKKTVTTTRSWRASTSMSMTVEMKVTAGIPNVASVESGFGWTVGCESVYELTYSETVARSWTWPLICPPGRQIHGTSVLYADNIDTDFEADVELLLENYKVFSYKEKGTYRGLNARYGAVSVMDIGPAVCSN